MIHIDKIYYLSKIFLSRYIWNFDKNKNNARKIDIHNEKMEKNSS